MNFIKLNILTLVMALGTYAPTFAQNQQKKSGSVIVILEGKVAQQIDYQLNNRNPLSTEDAEKQLLIFDDKGNCVHKQYITTEIVTVGLHDLREGIYRFLFLANDKKIEIKNIHILE